MSTHGLQDMRGLSYASLATISCAMHFLLIYCHGYVFMQAPPGPKSLMIASMVKLPFVSRVGHGSLLHSLVESDVPLHTYGCQSVKAIM